jgi:hypothetical protein
VESLVYVIDLVISLAASDGCDTNSLGVGVKNEGKLVDLEKGVSWQKEEFMVIPLG